DPEAPAAGVSDTFVVAGYGDTEAALLMAASCEVVTYELEHLGAGVAGAVAKRALLRPGVRALRVTQDRLVERRFLGELGIPVAAWREVGTIGDARAAASSLGYPLRLKRPLGGYDGRSQWRIGGAQELEAVWADLDAAGSLLLERELDFVMELSAVCARGTDGQARTFPVAQNTHHAGILVESIAPAPVAPELASEAAALATRIAEALHVVGTLTAELFLLRDGSLVVNELAPRVHNSGHYTDDACVTSQFEQHVRAICGLPLGDITMRNGHAATVNVLGTGPRRPARATGLDWALADPAVRLHLYDKREVFERRKMGHVTVVGDSAEDALRRARVAAVRLGWAM
ncbi:MAG: 5-(carboxyamino)imidazole ribonucleotide synthase, partial [Chloroflexi bacterium]|nr:5-(carboxyamino)imidazole ribonucleotide synthase [Chloroflexota bacterium]